ncbi:glutamate racemase, partial [Streptomyces beihaiensis]
MPRSLPHGPGRDGPIAYGLRVKIALMDTGIGLLAAAAAVRRLRPDADLVLSSDPDSMPWGPRTAEDITRRALGVCEAAAAHQPDALIIACNTASVHALPAVRALLEPEIPVIGTVPAIKPAAAGGGPVAIWATPATTGSPYQRGLIRDFADGVRVTEVPCPGLADAVQWADEDAVDRAIAAAAALTPDDVRAVVLGCTHYELVAERIRAAVQRPGAEPLVL